MDIQGVEGSEQVAAIACVRGASHRACESSLRDSTNNCVNSETDLLIFKEAAEYCRILQL